jgi:urease accessory protein
MMVPAAALAHETRPAPDLGLREGFLHPVLGPDHLVTMIAVGLVSIVLGGVAIWRVPAVFVLALVVGGVAGYWDFELVAVELWIVGSLAIIGVVLLTRARPKLSWARVAAALFGFAHGNAHGLELPVAAGPVGFAVGFTLASLCCHMTGIGIGALVARTRHAEVMLSGIGCAVLGTSAFVWIAS